MVGLDELVEVPPYVQAQQAFDTLANTRASVVARKQLLPSDMQAYAQGIDALIAAMPNVLSDKAFFELVWMAEYANEFEDVLAIDANQLLALPSDTWNESYAQFMDKLHTVTLALRGDTSVHPSDIHHVVQAMKKLVPQERSREGQNLVDSIAPYIVPSVASRRATFSDILTKRPGYETVDNGFTIRYDGNASNLPSLAAFARENGFTGFQIPADRKLHFEDVEAMNLSPVHIENEEGTFNYFALETGAPENRHGMGIPFEEFAEQGKQWMLNARSIPNSPHYTARTIPFGNGMQARMMFGTPNAGEHIGYAVAAAFERAIDLEAIMPHVAERLSALPLPPANAVQEQTGALAVHVRAYENNQEPLTTYATWQPPKETH
jgi:hypothetical protein